MNLIISYHFPFKLSPFNWSCNNFFTIPSLYCNFLDSFSIWPECDNCIDCICMDFCLNISCHFWMEPGSPICCCGIGWLLWWWGPVLICLFIDSLDLLRRWTASLRRIILLFKALKRRLLIRFCLVKEEFLLLTHCTPFACPGPCLNYALPAATSWGPPHFLLIALLTPWPHQRISAVPPRVASLIPQRDCKGDS